MIKKLGLRLFATSGLWLSLTQNAFAQSATQSAPKGGTSSSLPSAGTTELTYILFLAGVLLFVIGTMKLVLSFRD